MTDTEIEVYAARDVVVEAEIVAAQAELCEAEARLFCTGEGADVKNNENDGPTIIITQPLSDGEVL